MNIPSFKIYLFRKLQTENFSLLLAVKKYKKKKNLFKDE